MVHLLQCPQPHPRVPQPTSFYLPLLGCLALYCPSNGQAGAWAPLHPPAHCPGTEVPGVSPDYFPPGVTGEGKAGEAAGTVARNILAPALSGSWWKAFVPTACNGFQERASIFAANRGTKDVEGYCELSKGKLILGRAALVRRGSSAGRAAGGVVIYEQL